MSLPSATRIPNTWSTERLAEEARGRSVLLRVSHQTAESWNQLLQGFSDQNLLQTWEWGEVKSRTASWEVERLEFVHAGRIVGTAQVLVRRLPLLLGGMAWINRGPLWDLGSGPDHLPGILALLHERYTVERGLYLRIAPTVSEGALADLLQASRAFQDARAIGHRAGRIDLTR
jgi:hypothetical protein